MSVVIFLFILFIYYNCFLLLLLLFTFLAGGRVGMGADTSAFAI